MTTKVFAFYVGGPDEEGRHRGVAITEQGRMVIQLSVKPDPDETLVDVLDVMRRSFLEPKEPKMLKDLQQECPNGWTIEWVERKDPRPDIIQALTRFTERTKKHRYQETRHRMAREQKPPKPLVRAAIKDAHRTAPGWRMLDEKVDVSLDDHEVLKLYPRDRWENLHHPSCSHLGQGTFDAVTGEPKDPRGRTMTCVNCMSTICFNGQGAPRRCLDQDYLAERMTAGAVPKPGEFHQMLFLTWEKQIETQLAKLTARLQEAQVPQ